MVDTGFWKGKRVIVTGGAGFLGSHVVKTLRGRGATDIVVPRIEDYDLTDPQAIRRLLDATLAGVPAPQVIILHLAAHVGGIGANREHPAEFFYDNLMMGVELMHQAWQRGEITMTNLDIYLKQTGHFSIFRKECHTLRVS